MIRNALSLLLVALAVAPIAAAGPAPFLKKPNSWFAGDEAKRIAEAILSYQADSGGFPKNVDTTAGPFTGDHKTLKPTFDNGATTNELRFLARIFNATKNETYRVAFDRGLAYVLKAQYPNGGWPQFFPLEKNYRRHITFNDGAMVRAMIFVREVANDSTYSFVGDARRVEARKAFDRGVDCILKCQIVSDGKPTVWCAQHDSVDFKPQSARTYELPSFSGAESVGIVRLLMSLERPSPDVVRAVEGAIAWFESAKLTGIREAIVDDPSGPGGKNKVLVTDPTAPPLWARFYDLETNKPFFCDRDGKKQTSLAEIGYERRNGYGWYGTWAQTLLDREYPAWKKRIGMTSATAEEPATVKIALAGDSTVTDKAGWGLAFGKLFGPKATVVNYAVGGQSSKSFRDKGNWKKLLDSKPQWVLIQFGHNDQPGKGPERETDPKTTYRENLAKCVDEARAIGAKPILVTSLVRRVFEANGKLRVDLDPYAEAVRGVAAEKKVPLVDLHVRSKELCEKLGPKASEAFGPPHPKLKDKVDGTHLNEKGASIFAAIVAEQVKKSAPELGALLK